MPLIYLAIPLVAVVILNVLFKWVSGKTALITGMAVAVIQMVLAAVDLGHALSTGSLTSAYVTALSIDWFGAVVLLIIGLIEFVTLLVSYTTVKSSVFSFGNVAMLLMLGMNGIVMVTDLFSLYVFIEVTSAASFILIAINKKRDELEGAFKYYLMSALATVMMLLSIAILFMLAGDTSYAAVAAYVGGLAGQYPAALVAAIILFIAALSIKSGAVPFHTWVPDAHSSAPSPVSVILAGVVIKVSGAYALMRVYRDVFLNNPAVGGAMAILALASIIIGALGAMGQTDIKRMLAFSSVSQVGYIVLGAAMGSPLGFLGAILHFFNHATFKSLLFVDAAAVLKQTGTRDMDKMGGLAERMPFTGASSVLGLLSMAGIPPLSGFWSKLLILMAVWQVNSTLAIIALCASILTLTYFLILQKKVFFGKVAQGMEDVKEAHGSMVFVEVLLSGLNVVTGIVVPFLLVFAHGKGLI